MIRFEKIVAAESVCSGREPYLTSFNAGTSDTFPEPLPNGRSHVTTRQKLRSQLEQDILKLQGMILRISDGEGGIKPECDELRGAVQIKQALLAGVRRRGPWT